MEVLKRLLNRVNGGWYFGRGERLVNGKVVRSLPLIPKKKKTRKKKKG